MNRQQIAAVYDSFPPEQKNIPRAEFIKRAMNTMDPTVNGEILAQMVQGKQRVRQAQVQKAVIDSAITRGKV